MKKLLSYPLNQSFLAAIACISVLSACQQPPTQKAVTPSVTAKSTASVSASPSPSASVSPSTSPSPSANLSASPTEPATDKGNIPNLDKLAGEYTIVLDPKVLADAEKEGVKSVTGKWTIKSEGTFEAVLKVTYIKDEDQEIKTTGKILSENGKIVSQLETVNGEKPTQTPPKQPYTLSADGKELQADGQPVKLVRQ